MLSLDHKNRTTSDALKDVLRGLVTNVNGLSSVRNKMGDSHPVTVEPTKSQARLIVNSANTVSDFLLSTYKEISR